MIGFLVVSVVSVISIGISIVVITSSIKKLSLSSSTLLAVDCISGCSVWEVKAVAAGSGLVIFSVVLVIVIVIGVHSSRKKSSSLSSTALAVDCISGCGSWEVEAMAGGSHHSIFAVVSVIIIIGCVIGISVVIGIIVQKVVVLHIKLTWMLAFSALKSMHCGGGVMGR